MREPEIFRGACYMTSSCSVIISRFFTGTVSEDYQRVLDLYARMQQKNDIRVDRETFLCAIKASKSTKSPWYGHQVHNRILEDSCEMDRVIGNALIDMYAKWGALDDAHRIFLQMPSRNVVSWGALITAFAQHGHGISALTLFKKMLHEEMEPNKVIYLGSLKACSCAKSVLIGNLLYKQIIEKGLDLEVTIGNSVIDMYGKCKRFEDARKAFDLLPFPTVVSCGAMLAAYVENNDCIAALDFFQNMQEKGIKPNAVTFLCVLKACGRVRALDQGRRIHKQVGNYPMLNMIVCNALMDMYVRCNSINEAHRVFDQMSNHDSASYDIMIAGYSHHDKPLPALKLLSCMDVEGISPNVSTFVHALNVCSSVVQGQIVHCCIAKDGLDMMAVTGASLIHMYKRYGHILEAFEVFHNLSEPDIIAWGTMIETYAEHGEGFAALELLAKMEKCGLKPNIPILLSVLKVCTGIETIKTGRHIHNHIIVNGNEEDALLGTSLIHMYAKCGNLGEAHMTFRNLEFSDVASWCTLISGYAQCGYCLSALELFEEMLQSSVEPDEGVLVSVMKACADLYAVSYGRLIHSYIICCGFEPQITISSAMTDFYTKCGSMDDASKVFEDLPRCKDLPWGPMLTGYIQQDHLILAFELFEKMLQEGVELDKVIILGLLKVFSCMGSMRHGNLILDVIITNGLESDIIFGNALIDMYAKCGGIYEAIKVFDSLPFRDIVAWGAIIAAFAQHGHYRKVNECVDRMQTEGSRPTESIFINILAACSHGGSLHGGHSSFLSMTEDHDIKPDIQHYSSMIDLLSRVGHLDKAEDVLRSMPRRPDTLGWTALLTSCKTYGSVGIGIHCHDQVSLHNVENDISTGPDVGTASISRLLIEADDTEIAIVGGPPNLKNASRFVSTLNFTCYTADNKHKQVDILLYFGISEVQSLFLLLIVTTS